MFRPYRCKEPLKHVEVQQSKGKPWTWARTYKKSAATIVKANHLSIHRFGGLELVIKERAIWEKKNTQLFLAWKVYTCAQITQVATSSPISLKEYSALISLQKWTAEIHIEVQRKEQGKYVMHISMSQEIIKNSRLGVWFNSDAHNWTPPRLGGDPPPKNEA